MQLIADIIAEVMMRAVLLLAAAKALVPTLPTPQRTRPGAALTMMAETKKDVAVVILAGGTGSRMKADRPKQFLPLRGKMIIKYSLDLFLNDIEGICKVVVVLAEQYRQDFKEYADRVTFADPGAERQDSVKSGLDSCPDDAALVAIHDAARPLVTPDEIYSVFGDAREHGAAVLGVPVKATVKESGDGKFVLRTVDRSRLWEVHTPQVIEPSLLKRGFAKVDKEKLEITDDVSVVEQLGGPVRLTLGEYTNLKVTTPDDMVVAGQILDQRRGKKWWKFWK